MNHAGTAQSPGHKSRLGERLVVPFEELRMTDVDSVGGKNASLGEMISQLHG
ncbi:MAG: phosphoenolpyruvate synthase, partial [Pseudomonadota bacterium]